jgi:hypothetical protein
MVNHPNRSRRKKRVTTLLNAIADLHEGDLLEILELDRMRPHLMAEFGENDTFHIEDGNIVHTPGWPPPSKSLKHRVRTGEELARILEHHLMSILVAGELALPSCQKYRKGKQELGGRGF